MSIATQAISQLVASAATIVRGAILSQPTSGRRPCRRPQQPEVVRTIYHGEVSWAVPIPLYRVYAMVSVNKANRTLAIGTVISPWQYQRHINSAYCGRSEPNGEAY